MSMKKKSLSSLFLIHLLTIILIMLSTDNSLADNHQQQTDEADNGQTAQPLIPQNFQLIRSTPFWNKDTVPHKLLSHHNTEQGVYAQISVMRGALMYSGFNSQHDQIPVTERVINAGQFGISPPQQWHRVKLLTGDTCFNVSFFADPQQAGKGDTVHQPADSPEKKQ